MLHTKIIEAVTMADNLIDSLKETIAVRAEYMKRPMLTNEVLEQEQTQNGEDALAIMYLNSLLEEVMDYVEPIRMLDEIVNGQISIKTFNKRFEESRFGDE